MAACTVRITTELLHTLLGDYLPLPEGMECTGIVRIDSNSYAMAVDGVAEDMAGKEVRVIITRRYDKAGRFILESTMEQDDAHP